MGANTMDNLVSIGHTLFPDPIVYRWEFVLICANRFIKLTVFFSFSVPMFDKMLFH